MNRVRYRWRDEYEGDPEYQRILARMETPWWKRPMVLIGGVVAVVVASFSGGSGGSDHMTAAEKGVGFIRFYSAAQSQEYLAACEQELTALTRQ